MYEKKISVVSIIELTAVSADQDQVRERERGRSELKIIYGFAVAAHGACPRHDALISMTSDLPICLAIYIYI